MSIIRSFKYLLLFLAWLPLFNANLFGQNTDSIDYDYILRLIEEENDSCIAYIDTLLKTSESNATLIYAKGVFYTETEKIETAKYYYYQTIKADSAYFDAYYNLAVLYYNQGIESQNGCIEPTSYEDYLERCCKAYNYFYLANNYFQKAYAIKPNEESLKELLNEVKQRLNILNYHQTIPL